MSRPALSRPRTARSEPSRSRPFVGLHKLKLIDTSAEHFFSVLEHKKAGTSTNHYLRRLHNYALHLGWLLSPVMADAAWPVVRGKKFSSITEDEHQRIIAKEGNSERRLYYELLWETGGSQSDIANLNSKRVDRRTKSSPSDARNWRVVGWAELAAFALGSALSASLISYRKREIYFRRSNLRRLSTAQRNFAADAAR